MGDFLDRTQIRVIEAVCPEEQEPLQAVPCNLSPVPSAADA
jgi:hypothetical protein